MLNMKFATTAAAAAAVVVFAASVGTSGAQTVVVDTVAEIVNFVGVRADQDLDFGSMTSPNATMTVEVEGLAGNSGGAQPADILGSATGFVHFGDHHPAIIAATGLPSTPVEVDLPTVGIFLTCSACPSTAPDLLVDQFEGGLGGVEQAGTTLKGNINGQSGQVRFWIGATLRVVKNQPVGVYTGTFDAIVSFP